MYDKTGVSVYLAASMSRQDEMRRIKNALNRHGIEVTSRWITQPRAIWHTDGERYVFSQQRALIDLADIRRADMLIRFTDDMSEPMVPTHLITGSRLVEMGVAIERGIPILVVGGYQPIFDYLPNVTHIPNTVTLLKYLTHGPALIEDQNRVDAN